MHIYSQNSKLKISNYIVHTINKGTAKNADADYLKKSSPDVKKNILAMRLEEAQGDDSLTQ